MLKIQTVLDRLLDLMQQSVLTQFMITSSLVITTCYLYATSGVVPNDLLTLDTLVIGFYFGSKVTRSRQ